MVRRIGAVLVVIALAAGVAVAVSLRKDERSESLTEVSNRGKPISLALDVGARPNAPMFGDEAFVLAQRGDREFYRLPATPTACWGTGTLRRGSRRVGAIGCQSKPQFPSSRLPVMDFSPITMSHERPFPHYMRLEGIAADGVAQIAVIDADDRLHPAADVVENVYYADTLPQGSHLGLAALNGRGDVIWRTPRVRSMEQILSRRQNPTQGP
ncbi:MAG TPA: hypothetical protein VH968_01435 [Gaiellaceae bacterium]|jgi:hypothetical protein